MKSRRQHRSWETLRAHEGGVKLPSRVDPSAELVKKMRDAYVREYDEALRAEDHELAERLTVALRALDVRI